MHEYGGRSYLPVPSLSLAGGFDLVFANFADQRLYAAGGAVEAGIEPVPLTPAEGGFRFADLALSPDGQEIWCVRETVLTSAASRVPHRRRRGRAAGVVAVPVDGSAASAADAIRVLVSGAQFFAFPTPSPDGTKLAWINWNHPNMPWDGTELRVGPRQAARWRSAGTALVMGGPDESVLAPLWRDDATLYVLSDASGWWNPYAVAASAGAARPLHPLDEEFAGPMWQLGGRPFELLGDGRLAVLHGLGEHHLGLLDPVSGELTDLDLPGYRTTVGELAVSGTTIATVAGGPRTPWSVLRIAASGDAELMERRAEPPRSRPRLPAGRAPGTAFRRSQRRHDPRDRLPARQSRGDGTRRRAPAVPRARARRPDVALASRPVDGEGILHQPGHRHHRRQLRRVHWLRT